LFDITLMGRGKEAVESVILGTGLSGKKYIYE
jgi:hypothetical protein